MATAPERPLLQVNTIEVVYNSVVLVLRGVSLQVPQEGIVALLGANGAGKSTTLKAISGLLRPERGRSSRAPSSSWASASTGRTRRRSCAWALRR
jgi:branched-chain amino acid transport system ATP-binding protein